MSQQKGAAMSRSELVITTRERMYEALLDRTGDEAYADRIARCFFISQGHPFVGVKYGDPINDAGEKGANKALVFLVKLADELKLNSAVSLYARGARYNLSEEEIVNMEDAARYFLESEYHYPPKS